MGYEVIFLSLSNIINSSNINNLEIVLINVKEIHTKDYIHMEDLSKNSNDEIIDIIMRECDYEYNE